MHVPRLKDSEGTIQFTRTINSLFDLLNGRQPKDGIFADTKRDKLKVCTVYFKNKFNFSFSILLITSYNLLLMSI